MFPNLFVYATDRSVKASDCMVTEGYHILWDRIFRIDLIEDEERDLFSLLGALDHFSLLGEGTG